MPESEHNPSDAAAPEEPSAGEDICPDCGGTGTRGGERCDTCGGSGRVIEPVGGG